MAKPTSKTNKPKPPTAREMLQPSVLRQTQLELMGDDVDVKDLYLALNHVGIDIEKAVTEIEIERTIEGASTVTVTVYDRDFTLLRSGRLSARNDIQIDGLYFRLKGVNLSGHTITLTFEDREVAILRTYSKPIKQSSATARGSLTRAEFVLRMLKEVQEFDIKYYIPELHKTQPIDSGGKKPLTFTNTAKRGTGIPKVNGLLLDKPAHQLYEGQRKVANTVLDTGASMGLVRPLLVMGIMCAIQESKLTNLPLDFKSGSVGVFQQIKKWGWPASGDIPTDASEFFKRLSVKYSASPHTSYNDLIQLVQGSGHPTLYGQWRQQAEAIVNNYGVTDSAAHKMNNQWSKLSDTTGYEFYRGLPPTGKLNKQKYGGSWGPESTWECITRRLAPEVNWRAFFVSGVFYFLSEDNLIKSQPVATIDHSSPGIDSIEGDYDENKKSANLTIQCRIGRWQAPPGSVVQVINMGPWNGRWLVNDVSRSLYSSQGTITLKKASPRLPEPSDSNLIKGQAGNVSLDWAGNKKAQDPTGKYPSNWVQGSPVLDMTSKGGLHDTGGLAGYPAYDWFAPAGSPCVAPIAGTVTYLSGHDPALGAVEGAGGPLGWSVYIRGIDGNEYYLTHMGSRKNLYIGRVLTAGEVIGTVANYHSYGRADHIHMGVHIGYDPNH